MPLTSSALSITVAGIEFPSLILNASGTFNPSLFHQLAPLPETLGGIVTKTVTQEPWPGNPQARTVELPQIGMLNSIGLQNPGLEYTLAQEASQLKSYGLPVILSISAHSSQEFARMAQTVAEHPQGNFIDALEVNLSCPNVEKGGVHFGSGEESVKEAIAAIATVYSKPIFAKLTPNVTDIVRIGGAALEGGAQGLTAINTVLGVAIDIKRKKPAIPRVSAGYSGPGIKPIALHAIWQLRKHFPEAPILGVGGINNTHDVLEFLMAGATMVQVGTSCFRNPLVFRQVSQELQQYCTQNGLSRLSEISSCAH